MTPFWIFLHMFSFFDSFTHYVWFDSYQYNPNLEPTNHMSYLSFIDPSMDPSIDYLENPIALLYTIRSGTVTQSLFQLPEDVRLV